MTMSLPEYIDAIGEEAAATLFEVKIRTIQSWRRRERYPRAEQATKIVGLSGGKVDYDGIFNTKRQAA